MEKSKEKKIKVRDEMKKKTRKKQTKHKEN